MVAEALVLPLEHEGDTEMTDGTSASDTTNNEQPGTKEPEKGTTTPSGWHYGWRKWHELGLRF